MYESAPEGIPYIGMPFLYDRFFNARVNMMTLEHFFQEHPRAALAFSGGADSAFLLWAAKTYGCEVRPYYVRSAFQPAFELEHARKLAAQLEVELTILDAEVLCAPHVAENGPDRCYHCKRALFTMLRQASQADGYPLLLDGTNASDDAGDRPGMRALKELEVRSPLRECGMTKAQVRELSKKAGLFTWDKPAYACLATRVPTGTTITAEALRRVERAEASLFSLGFTDFRVRLYGNAARVQVPGRQMERLLSLREKVLEELSPLFDCVLLDLAARADMEV